MTKEKANQIKIVVDIIYCNDKQLNKFMHVADVFEKSKVIGVIGQLTITADPEVDVKNIPNHIKNAYEHAGGYLVFAGIKMFKGKTMKKRPIYFQKGINQISNGEHWTLFSNLLKSMGYDVTTNEHMIVTNVK